MQSQTIQVNGQNIAVTASSGTGPAALLIDGNSASGRSFRHQLASPLGERHRLVAIDLLGHGQSANAADPQSTNTLPGYADVVADVVNQLDLTGAVLVGWSLGGHIALEAEHLLPNAAGLLILARRPSPFRQRWNRLILKRGAAFTEELNEAQIEAFVRASFNPGVTDIPAAFLEDVRRTDGRARSSLAASIRPSGYRDEVEIVAQLSKPLAILQGEGEQLVNLAYLQNLSAPTLWVRPCR